MFGYALNGEAWISIYAVSPSEFLQSFEPQLVTFNGQVTIQSIAMYGRNSLPDTGSTLAMLAGAVALLLIFRAAREF